MVLENGLHNYCFLILKNTNNQDYKQKNARKLLFGQPILENKCSLNYNLFCNSSIILEYFLSTLSHSLNFSSSLTLTPGSPFSLKILTLNWS